MQETVNGISAKLFGLAAFNQEINSLNEERFADYFFLILDRAVGNIVARYPFRMPVVFTDQAKLKNGFIAPVILTVVFVPEPDLPDNPCSGGQLAAVPFDVRHTGAFNLARVPQGVPVIVNGADAICGLFNSALTIPEKVRTDDVYADGIRLIFTFQIYCFHNFSPFNSLRFLRSCLFLP